MGTVRAVRDTARRLMGRAPPVTRQLGTGASRKPRSLSAGGSSHTAGVTVPGGERALCVSARSGLCWSCRAALSRAELFCPSCTSLQPPDHTKDYFQVLGCDKSFNVDIQELQKKYRNLQRLLHPDHFSQKSQNERDLSEKQSSLVNKAYGTLLSPLSRGLYLLSQHGITLEDGSDGVVDAQFLFEILEISEKLTEINGDVEIEEIGNVVQAKCEKLTEEVRNAFQQGNLKEVKILLAKMKYFSNIQNQVKKKILP